MQYLRCNILLLFVLCIFPLALSRNQNRIVDQAETYQDSSDPEDLNYHMGPVLASPINLYIIWYGNWKASHQDVIKDFIYSISSQSLYPSVANWWSTVRLYADQTGSNITGKIVLSGEFYDSGYSHGINLSRITMQYIIKNAVSSHPRALPLDPRNGLYLVLTSSDVKVEEFCRAICGFHYFTFPTIVGVTVPFSWIGHSGTQCPGRCGYPSGRPTPGNNIMLAPNGDAGVDGMISVIGHELAEVSSDPLVNAWYAGEDPSAPTEIADMCQGVYGSGAGGGYVGVVYRDRKGIGYNVNGIKGRKFMVQWIWHPEKRRCFGPNAIN